MISFVYRTNYKLRDEAKISDWLHWLIESEQCELGEIEYTFCTDEELHKINMEFLGHDTYTDIISFDYSVGKLLQGEIFISLDRVMDNAEYYKVTFELELQRVIAHGVLHYCGYKDKTGEDKKLMRTKENYYLAALSLQ